MFIAGACADDPELRRMVDALVSGDERAGSFLESPPVVEMPPPPIAGGLVGRQFGPYRVLSLLGAGGMGEVYRAHDSRLGRDVAIKALPPEFARDPVRLARLMREARTLAALNHPHIATIYGLEDSAETSCIVLELVEGETPRGPLALRPALDLACQVADALQTAHEHGIVHRDLKPANLKVTPQGQLKVLDFGLAKAVWGSGATPEAGPTAAPQTDRTGTGHVLGTPGYMSPEQARGAEVDERTDIWAFGCLLYEWLAGRRAFPPGTACGLGPGEQTAEPDWEGLPADTPARVRDLLSRCLQPNVDRRLDRIADARATLQAELVAPPSHPSRSTLRALAVLPLVNLTGDPDQEYFVDGMTEALIAELGQIHAIDVISKTSAMHYKGSTKTLPEIARELAVDAIVEGSVMRAGDRVRISAQLIEAATDRHLWAHSCERALRDVIGLQGEVARAIADEIQVTLTPQERARLTRPRPVNADSHEEYVRGRFHFGRVQPGKSLEHFERAIALDPDNALAHAGIADAHCMMFGGAMEAVPPSQVAPLARAAAVRALEMDETLAEPHVSLARVLFWHDRDAVGAERELRHAIQINPSCAMAHMHAAILFADFQRVGESVAAFQRTLQLDPVSCFNVTLSGFFLWNIGRDEMGKEQLQKALDLDPTFFFAWSTLAIVHALEGRPDEAVAEALEGVRLSRGLPAALGWAAYVLGRAGRRAEAAETLDQLDRLSRERYVAPVTRAWCRMGLDDHSGAIECLEDGYRQRDSGLPHIGVVRVFNPLGPDPRFQDLLRRLGLPR